MKKLIFIAVLICGMQIQAQKTLKIYNYTGNTVIIDDLVTRSGIVLPEFHSKPFGPVTIVPFGSYTMVNLASTVNFPFNSPTSTPVITKWERITATAPTSTVMLSLPAWLQGATQIFFWVQVRIGANTKHIGVAGSGYPLTSTSNGWTASYTIGGTAPAPVYTITIQ
jgi:hypothetical protein